MKHRKKTAFFTFASVLPHATGQIETTLLPVTSTAPSVISAESVLEMLKEWIAQHSECLILSTALLVLLTLTVFCLLHYIRLCKNNGCQATKQTEGKV